MAEPKLYLRHKETGRRYEIVTIDRTTGKAKLRGELAEIEEDWNPQRFKQLGYTLEKEEV